MKLEQTVGTLPAATTDIAGEIRRLGQMESSRQSAGGDSGVAANSISRTIQHLLTTSLGEIDQVIIELTQLRGHVEDEAKRVHGELVGYTQTTQVALQAALTSAEAITQSLAQLKCARSEIDSQPNGGTLDQFEER